jgi:hypothetical protein
MKLLLLLILAACTAGSVAGLFTVAASDAPDDLEPSPLPRRLFILAFLGLINVGCSVGVWAWKRWGVYGVVCVSLVAFMLNWKIGGPVVALPGLIGPAALGLVAGITWLEYD